jgi:hypothetical protein
VHKKTASFTTDGFAIFYFVLILCWCFAPLDEDTGGGEDRSGTPAAEEKQLQG